MSTKHLKSTVHGPAYCLTVFLLVTVILSVYGSQILMSINGIWLKKILKLDTMNNSYNSKIVIEKIIHLSSQL